MAIPIIAFHRVEYYIYVFVSLARLYMRCIRFMMLRHSLGLGQLMGVVRKRTCISATD